MSTTVKLELPDDLSHMAEDEARRTKRPIEDVLTEWLERLAHDAPIEALPDAQVLALCDMELDVRLQDELAQLLDRQREDGLGQQDERRLHEIMKQYRSGLVRKARAWKVAADRGLRSAAV